MTHDCNCGCEGCKGVTALTPAPIFNRPGLSEIQYRAGDHASFKSTMLAQLSSPGLEGLRTRSDDDFSIGLIDGWAVVADILTFYQERIANENYLRTATERVSLQEMAKLIGYQLRPGLAAETYVSFRMENPPAQIPGSLPAANALAGSPQVVQLAPGIKIQSVPGPGEQPQTFETTEAIEARVAWNELRPLRSVPYGTTNVVTLRGAQSALQIGDTLLLEPTAASSAAQIRRVSTIAVDSTANLTRVTLESAVALDSGSTPLSPGTKPVARQTLSTALAQVLTRGRTWAQDDLMDLARTQEWDLDALASAIDTGIAEVTAAASTPVHLMGTRASVFGHNALLWKAIPANAAAFPYDWDKFNLVWADPELLKSWKLDLDIVYPGLVAGKWVAFSDPGTASFGVKIASSQEVSRTGFALTGKVTRLELPDIWAVLFLDRRATKVLGETGLFALAPKPSNSFVTGSHIRLDSAVLRLRVGQKIEIAGQPNDQAAPTREVRTIQQLTLEDGYTRMDLDAPLRYSYNIDSVRINANVAAASHGETRQEIAGSGDGSRIFQRFVLKQPPLTYTSAATPSGVASTLAVSVNGVTWHEVPSLYGQGPRDRVFVTTRNENGKTLMQFGDGVTGARLSSGQDNVQAKYRQGIGSAGLVKAGQLSQLLTRPLGVRDAANPVAASGGDDPETVEQARGNAPFTVRALDRVVSLDDYEDFARASAGVAKAMAAMSWDHGQRVILITVAGSGGTEIKSDGKLYGNLLTALRNAGDPHLPVILRSYRPAAFSLAATLTVDPDRDAQAVRKAVQDALLRQYSFAARMFAQPVFLSEALAVMQNVPGVIAVIATGFRRTGKPALASPPEWLTADPPVISGAASLGAELLTIDPNSLAMVEVKA